MQVGLTSILVLRRVAVVLFFEAPQTPVQSSTLAQEVFFLFFSFLREAGLRNEATVRCVFVYRLRRTCCCIGKKWSTVSLFSGRVFFLDPSFPRLAFQQKPLVGHHKACLVAVSHGSLHTHIQNWKRDCTCKMNPLPPVPLISPYLRDPTGRPDLLFSFSQC